MRRVFKAQYKRDSADSTDENGVSWVPGMRLGRGAPVAGTTGTHLNKTVIKKLERFTGPPTWVYRDEQSQIEVRWICPLPQYNEDRDATSYLIEAAARRFRMKVAWVMCGLHSKTTTARIINTQGDTKRFMADDDLHTTVRFCREDRQICHLHGHLYAYTKEIEVPDINEYSGTATIDIAKRLATEDERTYVGGQPFHIWIWGTYAPRSKQWPRLGPTLPKPPFERKPQYKYLDREEDDDDDELEEEINTGRTAVRDRHNRNALKQIERDRAPLQNEKPYQTSQERKRYDQTQMIKKQLADRRGHRQRTLDRKGYARGPMGRRMPYRESLEQRDRYQRSKEPYRAPPSTWGRTRSHEEVNEARARRDWRNASMDDQHKRAEYR